MRLRTLAARCSKTKYHKHKRSKGKNSAATLYSRRLLGEFVPLWSIIVLRKLRKLIGTSRGSGERVCSAAGGGAVSPSRTCFTPSRQVVQHSPRCPVLPAAVGMQKWANDIKISQYDSISVTAPWYRIYCDIIFFYKTQLES